MGDDQETITVAELSDGAPLGEQPDESVDLPVVEILTGRGFITGKSRSGKSNTASVVAEKLLDNGFGLLIVDIDGEYYGLKEEYEILHVGADEECDIQVTVEHAEKIASLALEQNVPIILDVSSFLDEEEAQQLLTEVSKQLFAKEKKHKQPFLMLVEEVHEYIPEKGSVGECGKMLIKIGKRGRKHGLGIVGISQRPADVKKDFITQCDWLVWHRLTWNNDTKVVSRILDSEYSNAVEDLDDGEAFMMNDWSESVQRVQFHRKQTFDAGATPGLDDFDRPDLKSVSSDLVSELEEISDEEAKRESRIEELREELDRKNSRIAELEAELKDARDLQRMATEFVDAMVEAVEGTNPGRTAVEEMREKRTASNGSHANGDGSDTTPDPDAATVDPDAAVDESDGAMALESMPGTEAVPVDAKGESADENGESEPASVFAAPDDVEAESDSDGAAGEVTGSESSAGTAEDATTEEEPSSTDEDVAGAMAAMESVGTFGADASVEQSEPESSNWDAVAATVPSRESETGLPTGTPSAADEGDHPPVVSELTATISAMRPKTRSMLRYYRREGPCKPLDAHFAAGGDGDRANVYAHNRTLRTHGFVEHVGRGYYDDRLRDLVREEHQGDPYPGELDDLVAAIEEAFQK